MAAASLAAWATTAAAWGASPHYIGQGLLGGSLAGQVANVWPLVDPSHVLESGRQVAAALVPVVQQHAMAARALANEHYLSERMQGSVLQPFMPQVVELPQDDKVYQYVDWALRDLGSAEDDGSTLLVPAQRKAAQALQKLVSDTGRDQVIQNVMDDRAARGWAREARPGACWFCAMLATRGAVYRSAWTAGRRTYDGVPVNSFHRNCQCQVVPLFRAYEPPAHVREWQQVYGDATKDVYGADKAWAFQEAYEGRSIQRKSKKWNGYGVKNRDGGRQRGKQPRSADEQQQIAADMVGDRAQQALNRARELYALEGDPVGDRASWIGVLEDRLGQPHLALPDRRTLLEGWDDAKLQAALGKAQALLGNAGDPGGRAEWIARLKAEQARRLAVHV